MKYAFVARNSMDARTFAGWYAVKYVAFNTANVAKDPARFIRLTLDEATPPIRRRRGDGSSCWDYANAYLPSRAFHGLYPHIRLKPDEGPILVDLDDTQTKRTSRHQCDI